MGGVSSEQSSEKSSVQSSVLSSEQSSVLTAARIIDEIKKNPKITANQLAAMLNITQRAVEKQLVTLKQSGRVNRVG